MPGSGHSATPSAFPCLSSVSAEIGRQEMTRDRRGRPVRFALAGPRTTSPGSSARGAARSPSPACTRPPGASSTRPSPRSGPAPGRPAGDLLQRSPDGRALDHARRRGLGRRSPQNAAPERAPLSLIDMNRQPDNAESPDQPSRIFFNVAPCGRLSVRAENSGVVNRAFPGDHNSTLSACSSK